MSRRYQNNKDSQDMPALLNIISQINGGEDNDFSPEITKTFMPDRLGKRLGEQGCGEGEQKIIRAVIQDDWCSRIVLEVTLLAAGFVIGREGKSIKQIYEKTGVSIRPDFATRTHNNQEISIRIFMLQGETTQLLETINIIVEAVDLYRTLLNGQYTDQIVEVQQVVQGITFEYFPPPITVNPYSARTRQFPGELKPSEYGQQQIQLHQAQFQQRPHLYYSTPFTCGVGYYGQPPSYTPSLTNTNIPSLTPTPTPPSNTNFPYPNLAPTPTPIPPSHANSLNYTPTPNQPYHDNTPYHTPTHPPNAYFRYPTPIPTPTPISNTNFLYRTPNFTLSPTFRGNYVGYYGWSLPLHRTPIRTPTPSNEGVPIFSYNYTPTPTHIPVVPRTPTPTHIPGVPRTPTPTPQGVPLTHQLSPNASPFIPSELNMGYMMQENSHLGRFHSLPSYIQQHTSSSN